MSIYTKHQPQSSDEMFLRLKDGDRVKLRILSEPAVTVYKKGDKPRYAWKVLNRDKGIPQVYGAGVSVYSQIADLVEEWGEPTEFDIVIKRTGAGLSDTSYSVTPVRQSDDPTEDQKKSANLIDLVKVTKGKWLADYEEDGVPPEPIVTGGEVVDEIVPMPRDEDAPIDLDNIPF